MMLLVFLVGIYAGLGLAIALYMLASEPFSIIEEFDDILSIFIFSILFGPIVIAYTWIVEKCQNTKLHIIKWAKQQEEYEA